MSGKWLYKHPQKSAFILNQSIEYRPPFPANKKAASLSEDGWFFGFWREESERALEGVELRLEFGEFGFRLFDLVVKRDQ